MATEKKNWNDFSSDEDDSWLKSSSGGSHADEKQPQSEPKCEQLPPSPQNADQPDNTGNADNSGKNNIHKSQKNRPAFPTDQEILSALNRGDIESDKIIKAIKCNSDAKEVLEKDSSIIRKNQFKPGCYILFFDSKQKLVEFIERKIQNKYRFYLAVFHSSNKERPEGHRREPKDRDDRKRTADRKSEAGGNRPERKPEYRQKNRDEYRDKYRGEDGRKYKQKEDPQKTKGEHSRKTEGKPTTKEGTKHQPDSDHYKTNKSSYQILKEGNVIRILSNGIDSHEFVTNLKHKKMDKSFSKIRFLYKPEHLQVIGEITWECWKQLKFGLETDIDEETVSNKQKDEQLEAVVADKSDPKLIKRWESIIGINLKENYFTRCEQTNQNILGAKDQQVPVSEKEYCEQFAKNHELIYKRWDKWVIKAYNLNIPKLLHLYARMKKQAPNHKYNLRVGMEQECPYTVVEIGESEREVGKARGKVDTSAVHSHLNN